MFRPTPILIAFSLALPATAQGEPLAETPNSASSSVERQLGMMGTVLTIRVDHENRRSALLASEAAIRTLETVEQRLSTWRADSELSLLNQSPTGQEFALSDELHRELTLAKELTRLTEGAFDPSIGGLLQAWQVRTGGRRPTPQKLEASRVPNGFDALELSPASLLEPRPAWARRQDERVRFDAGGFGKGAGLDHALATLRDSGAHAASLDLGGQLLVYGPSQAISLADPRDRTRPVLSVRLENESMATSGNEQRGLSIDGERLSHLFDPRTGQPARDFGSLTVIAPDAFRADALSTGLYVLGPTQAIEIANSLPSVELLILDTSQATVRARLTEGLRERISTLDPELLIEWIPSSTLEVTVPNPLHPTSSPSL